MEWEKEEAPTDKNCHWGIKNTTRSQEKKMFKRFSADISKLNICLQGEIIPFTPQTMMELKSQSK